MRTVRSRRAGSASAANRRLTGRSSRRSAALTPVLGDKAIKPKPASQLSGARARNMTYCGDCETSGRGDVPSPHRRFFTATRACDVDETAGWRMDSVLVETPTAPLARAPARPAPELSVMVPTFNERANIPLLVARLQRTLEGADWEVIFVDDNSLDGTAAAVRAIGETDLRVRCIRRIGRRGRGGARPAGARPRSPPCGAAASAASAGAVWRAHASRACWRARRATSP